jgi:AcrR family transcriptional regulator
MVSLDTKRAAIAQAVADFILAEGLEAASLRPIAKAAGLSDRMLLYYYRDKAAVIEAALTCAAERLRQHLEASVSGPRLERAALLSHLAAQMDAPELAPFVRLWLDIAARAARGETPFTTVGETIARSFLAWSESRLLAPADVDMATESARLFIQLEGLVFVRAVGLRDVADAALKGD